MATRCFIPPDSWAGSLLACAVSPTSARYRSVRRWRSSAGTPLQRAARTRRSGPPSARGTATYSWKTTPRSAPGPVTGAPSTRTRAGRRRQEAGHDVQERRLPAARRPEDAQELGSVRDLQVDLRQRLAGSRAAAERLADAVDHHALRIVNRIFGPARSRRCRAAPIGGSGARRADERAAGISEETEERPPRRASAAPGRSSARR